MHLEGSIVGLRRSTEILMSIEDMPLYEHVEIDVKRQLTVLNKRFIMRHACLKRAILQLRRSAEIIASLTSSTEILKFIKEI